MEVKFRSRLLWKSTSQIKIRWDIFIMLLATINCFQVPYNVVFVEAGDSSIFEIVINAIIDIFFILDVIINFRTSFIHSETGEEVTDWKSISLNYIKTRFFIDFIASIPFDYFSIMFEGESDNDTFILQMFSLLKLVRVLRLGRLITHLNLKNDVKTSLKLTKLIFFIILFIHFLGCVWFYIAKQNEKWIPPLDYVYITTDIFNEGGFMQYWNAAYHAVLMLGGNDVGPRGELQLIFVSLMLLVGAIINSIIFGNMAVVLQAMNKKSTMLSEKLEDANEAMKNLNIPEHIKMDVDTFLNHSQSGLDAQQELDKFLKMLSPSLKKKVSAYIFSDVILKNPLFEGCEDATKAIIQYIEIKLFLPEWEIIRQNEEGNSMFFLARGEWDVYITDQVQKEIFANSLSSPDYFGEVALIKECPRTATVVSKSYVTLAELQAKNFEIICEAHPEFYKILEKRIRKRYNDKRKKFIKRSIKNIDYFNNVSDQIIDEISYCFETVYLRKDNFLFKKGTQWKEIYIISNGELDIYIENSNRKPSVLETLGTGWILGTYR